MFKALIAAAAIVAWVTTAEAIDFTPTGAVLTVTYTEPTTNADNSPLDDLARTTINWRVCPASGPCATPYTLVPVPATQATGGGNISQQVTVPIAPGQQNNVEVFATATDTSGNVSAESAHVTKRVDRLSPAPPQ